MGQGPAILLLHGTGASTHSFRALAPLLAEKFTVILPDLPGHGFTAAPRQASGYSLRGVAHGVTALVQALGHPLTLMAGHSAGAAVAIRMCLDGTAVTAVVSLNGALLPFPGMANDFFGPIARLLATSGMTASAFAMVAGMRSSVDRMLRSTGSVIDAEGTRLYNRLARNPGHVHGALGLMANWDLRQLMHDLSRFPAHLVLVTGSRDGMVPPSEAQRVRRLLPKAQMVSLRGLGHLAHEERPDLIVSILEGLDAD
jgi:magnesium chelatase accessory protein